jgi:hypothetical protein
MFSAKIAILIRIIRQSYDKRNDICRKMPEYLTI